MSEIRDRESTGPLWIGVLVAFLYGVVHTLGPGHGKAVVISYFVGHGGSFGRGVSMGTQIAVFHVLSAILIALLADFAVRQTTGNAPSDYRMLKLISYASIAVIGGFMLRAAMRNPNADPAAGHHDGHADCGHAGCKSCHSLESQKSGPAGWLALALGSVPCTGALLVLLFGLSNDLLIPSILLVIAISAGMALAMSGIGVLAIMGRNLAVRRIGSDPSANVRFARGLRISGAALVLTLGLALLGLTVMN